MSRHEGFAPIPTWMIRERSIPRNAILVYASLSSRSGFGEIFPSQATIAEESGLSERTVRTMLAHLEEIGVVQRERRRVPGVKRATDAYTLHPNGLPATSAARRDLPANQPANEPRSTGNELQNVPLIEIDTQEIDIDTPTFDDFWAVWPRKDAKRDASRAWDRAVKKTAAEVIVAAARGYAESPHRPERQFVPYGATWLNGERWTDPLPEPATPSRSGPNERVRAGLEMGARLQAEYDARRTELAG